jgi:hypothetical protein
MRFAASQGRDSDFSSDYNVTVQAGTNGTLVTSLYGVPGFQNPLPNVVFGGILSKESKYTPVCECRSIRPMREDRVDVVMTVDEAPKGGPKGSAPGPSRSKPDFFSTPLTPLTTVVKRGGKAWKDDKGKATQKSVAPSALTSKSVNYIVMMDEGSVPSPGSSAKTGRNSSRSSVWSEEVESNLNLPLPSLDEW